jgi:hypothetical protein
VNAVAPEKTAPIHRSAKPIKDAQDRVEVIVDFDFDADKDKEFDDTISTDEERKWDGRKPKVIKFLNFFEKKYGLSRNGMTSWAKVSMTGFVTEAQLSKLSKDKRVTLVNENEYQSFSAFFSANDVITAGSRRRGVGH